MAVIKPEGRGFNFHRGQSFPLSLCGPNSISRANAHMVCGWKISTSHSTTRSDAPRRWRTRRPLASRVRAHVLFSMYHFTELLSVFVFVGYPDVCFLKLWQSPAIPWKTDSGDFLISGKITKTLLTPAQKYRKCSLRRESGCSGWYCYELLGTFTANSPGANHRELLQGYIMWRL